MKKLLAVFAFSFIFISIHSTVFASGTPRYTVKKNTETGFNYELSAGSSVQDFLTIKNLDANRWIEISLSEKGLPTRWLRTNENKVFLKPLEEKTVKLSINIPSSIEQEKYIGILIANLANYEEENAPESNFKIGLGIANEIKITIKEGEPVHLNFIKEQAIISTIVDKITPKKPIKEYFTDFHVLISNNTELILVLIIIGLLLKLAIQKPKIVSEIKEENTSSKKNIVKSNSSSKKSEIKSKSSPQKKLDLSSKPNSKKAKKTSTISSPKKTKAKTSSRKNVIKPKTAKA